MINHCPTRGSAVRVETSESHIQGVSYYMVPTDAERIRELERCLSRLNMAALNAIHCLPGGETKAELRDRYDEATELLEPPR